MGHGFGFCHSRSPNPQIAERKQGEGTLIQVGSHAGADRRRSLGCDHRVSRFDRRALIATWGVRATTLLQKGEKSTEDRGGLI